MADKKRFIPVTGSDATISRIPITAGNVYFAEDTGRIYYDIDSETRVPMGGSGVVIHYGKIPSDLDPESLNTYVITTSMLEESTVIPQVGDLILNDDGTFFRINDFDEDSEQFTCIKVLVSGGGGGGTSGGGGGMSIGRALQIVAKRDESVKSNTILNGARFPVVITAEAPLMSDGTSTGEDIYLSYEIAEGSTKGITGSVYAKGSLQDLTDGGSMTYDFGPELRQNTSSVITIYATCGSMDEGKYRTAKLYPVCSNLELAESSKFSNLNVFYATDSVSLTCEAKGNMNKILEILFDGSLVDKQPLYLTATSQQTQGVTIPASDARLTHGVHTVEFKLYQDVNPNNHTKGADELSIKTEIAVVDRTNPQPIIWLGDYKDKYTTYEDIQIPYKVYNNGKTTTTVYFYKNNQKQTPREITIGSKFEIYEIADANQMVTNYYAIGCGEQELEVRRNIVFTVVEDTEHKMVNPQADALRLNFDAKGRSNDETAAQRGKWVDSIKPKVSQGIFQNFNWNNNGWIMDDNKTCLRISNGASFIIPIDAMTFNGGAATNTSNSFDFQFKIRNIKDYSSLIKTVTRYKGDDDLYENIYKKSYMTQYPSYDSFLAYYLAIHEELGLKYDSLEFSKTDKLINLDNAICSFYNKGANTVTGFCVGPQDAFFSNGFNTVSAEFVENEMVYLTIVYDGSKKDANGASTPMMYIYVNGVLTGVVKTTLHDRFTINSSGMFQDDEGNNIESPYGPCIVFNSNACDIDLYKMRTYNVALSVNDVVTNYAVDKKDITTFEQNGLAEYNNTIQEYRLNYNNVLQYNKDHPKQPLMPYVIFDTTPANNNNRLSFSKKFKVKINMEFHNTPLELAASNGELDDLAFKDFGLTASSSQTEKDNAIRQYYLHHCPSFRAEGVQMAVQGTSSEFYPRRNYKIKTKTDDGVMMWVMGGPFAADYEANGTKRNKKQTETDPGYTNPCQTDWFYMNNYTNGTSKFTMKVDYMESSGSYNMGLANIVRNGYSKQPLEDYVNNDVISDTAKLESSVPELSGKIRWEDYRTSVQGFPVMAFHRYGESNEDVRFIGLYRMLTDKGSDELYGFKPDKKVTQLALPKTKKLKNEDGSSMLDEDGVQQIEITYPKVRDVAECWEFSDNNRGYCSFRDPWNREELSFRPAEYKEDGTPTTVEERYTSNYAPIVADSFEYRYSKYDDALDVIYELGPDRTFTGSLGDSAIATLKDAFGDDLDTTDLDAIHEQFYKAMSNYEKVCQWVWLTNIENVISGGEYVPATVGEYFIDSKNSFALEDEGSEYYLDSNASASAVEAGSQLVPGNTYYEKKTEVVSFEGKDIEKVKYVKVVMDDSENSYFEYAPNQFYTASTVDDSYILATENKVDTQKSYFKFNTLSTDVMDAKIAEGKSVAKHTKRLTERYPASKYPGYLTEDGYATWDKKKKYLYDTQEFRNEKFTNELKNHFDVEYLATYFVVTEVLECYDSRGKNCMIASWGPQVEGGDYIWYPIFYDMDTQLGINNTGIPSFAYNVDATEQGNFSTSDSLLWNNFYKNYKSTAIIDKYRHLKGENVDGWGTLDNPVFNNVNKLEAWYEADPDECNNIAMRGDRPLIATNLDEYWKYITITNNIGLAADKTDGVANTTGYQSSGTNGEYTFDNNGTYFYALQGDRSLSRRQFLTNRFEYIDSWLNQGNYQRGGDNRIRGRVSANYKDNKTNELFTSDKWIETDTDPYWVNGKEFGQKSHDFDSQYWLTLQPARNTYVTLGGDANSTYPSQKYSGVPINYTVQEMKDATLKSNLAEKLLYVYGMNQMASAGDLYKNYWTEFYLEGKFDKLNSLLLGCDGLMYNPDDSDVYLSDDGDVSVTVVKDENGKITAIEPFTKKTEDDIEPTQKAHRWFNNKINLPTMPSDGLPLLEEANFSNLNIQVTDPTLNLKQSEKLKVLRATGSNFTQIDLAPGAALHTLYLPATLTRIDLVQDKLLTNIVENYTYPLKQNGKYVAEKGLYVRGLTDWEVGMTPTNVSYLRIKGDAMGYDSYKLLEKFYNSRKSIASDSLIEMTDVQWTPYRRLVKGDEFDTEKLKNHRYFRDNGHYGYTELPQDYAAGLLFNQDIANGELYELDADFDEETYLIKDYTMFNQMMKETTHFRSTDGDTDWPTFSGDLYICNETPIDEATIRNTFNVKYPELNVTFKNVTPVHSMRFVLPDLDDKTNAYLGTYSYVPLKSGSRSKETSIQKSADFTTFVNPYTEYNPTEAKPNYDFVAWSKSYDMADTDSYISYATDSAENQATAWAEYLTSLEPNDEETYTIYALFTKHRYEVSFYNGESLLGTDYVMYNECLDGNITDYVPTHPREDTLKLNETYRFLGFSESDQHMVVESEKEAQLADYSMLFSVQDMKFYAVYIKVDVHHTLSDDEMALYSFELYNQIGQYTDTDDASYNVYGYTVYPTPGKKMSGKITLPTYYKGPSDEKALPVIAARGFNTDAQNISHVFWDTKDGDNVNFRCIIDNAFRYKGIQYFEFPSKLRIVGSYAFSRDDTLPSMTDKDCFVKFGQTAILEIGDYAFQTAFYPKNLDVFIIPGTVKTIGQLGIMFVAQKNGINASGKTLQIGTSTNRSVLSVCGNSSNPGIANQNSSYAVFSETLIYPNQEGLFNSALISSGAIQNCGPIQRAL